MLTKLLEGSLNKVFSDAYYMTKENKVQVKVWIDVALAIRNSFPTSPFAIKSLRRKIDEYTFWSA